MELVLVWFESASPGSAAGQHLIGTLQRLDQESVPVHAVVAQAELSDPGWSRRVRRLATVQLDAIRAGGRKRLLLVRWHPAALIPLMVQRIRGGRSVLMLQGNVADMHTAYPFTAKLPLEALLIRPSIALGSAHLAPNQGILDWANTDLGVRTPRSFVVENGFDGDAIKSVEPLTDSELNDAGVQRGRYALYVGKFAAWQGVDTILTAVDATGWPVDLPVVFVGDGAEARAVTAATQRNPLVRYIGRVAPDRALAWTQAAAIALAARKAGPASDRGVSPYKVLEAAAMGTPLVATRVRGQEELVEALGCGLLVRPDSSQELTEAVRRLWQNPDLRKELSQEGLRRAPQYAWRASSRGLLEVLQSVGFGG